MNRPFLKTTLRKKMTARSDDTRRRPLRTGRPQSRPVYQNGDKERKKPKVVPPDLPATGTERPEDRSVG